MRSERSWRGLRRLGLGATLAAAIVAMAASLQADTSTLLELDGTAATDGTAAARPAIWPPSVDSLLDEEGCRKPLPCDPNAHPGVELRGLAISERILETTSSTCSSAVQAFDARTRLGNVARRASELSIEGTCVLNAKGRPVGAFHDGVLASCEPTRHALGVIAHEAAIIDLRSGHGHARAPLTGLPWLLAGQSRCEIEVDVEMHRASGELRGPAPVATGPGDGVDGGSTR